MPEPDKLKRHGARAARRHRQGDDNIIQIHVDGPIATVRHGDATPVQRVVRAVAEYVGDRHSLGEVFEFNDRPYRRTGQYTFASGLVEVVRQCLMHKGLSVRINVQQRRPEHPNHSVVAEKAFTGHNPHAAHSQLADCLRAMTDRFRPRGILKISDRDLLTAVIRVCPFLFPEARIGFVGLNNEDIAFVRSVLEWANVPSALASEVASGTPPPRVQLYLPSNTGSAEYEAIDVAVLIDTRLALHKNMQRWCLESKAIRVVAIEPPWQPEVGLRASMIAQARIGPRLWPPKPATASVKALVLPLFRTGYAAAAAGQDSLAVKRDRLWHSQGANRRIADLANWLRDAVLRHNAPAWIPLKIRAQRQELAGPQVVVVESKEHATSLLEYLPDWRIGKEHPTARVGGSRLDGSILTHLDLEHTADSIDADVVFRADMDAGSDFFITWVGNTRRPFTIVDVVVDERLVRERAMAYRKAGFEVVVHGRTVRRHRAVR